jgi:hypothetical protein
LDENDAPEQLSGRSSSTFTPSELKAFIAELKLPPRSLNRLFGLKDSPETTALDGIGKRQNLPDHVNKTLTEITSIRPLHFRFLAKHRQLTIDELAAEMGKEMEPPWDGNRILNSLLRGPVKAPDRYLAARILLMAKEEGLDLFAPHFNREIAAAQMNYKFKQEKSFAPDDLKAIVKIFGLTYLNVSRSLASNDFNLEDIRQQPLKPSVIAALTRGRTPRIPPYTGSILPQISKLLPVAWSELAAAMSMTDEALAEAVDSPVTTALANSLTAFLNERVETKMNGTEFAEYVYRHGWDDKEAAEKLNTTAEMVEYARILGPLFNVPGHLPLLIKQYESSLGPEASG